MPVEYIRNPRTGRQIKVGGATYNKLMEEGVNFALVAAPQVPEEFVKNPRTGKQIKVGGPTYKKLRKQGYFGAGSPKGTPKKSPPKKSPPKKSPPKGTPKRKTPKRKSPKRRRTKGEFTVVELKKMLKEKGLPTTGKKADLMVRYQKALQTPAPPAPSPKAKSPTPKRKSPAKSPPKNIRTGLSGTGRGKGGGKGLGLGAKGLGGAKRRPRTPSPRTPSGSPPMRRNNPPPRSLSPSSQRQQVLPKEKSPTPKRSSGRKSPQGTPKRSPGRKTQQKFDCPVCLDDVDEEIKCKKCNKGVCLECYKGIVGVNAKCPQCREPFEEKDIRARVSPRTLARKMEKRKEFQKAIDDERTQFDVEIARQLQEQMNREMNGGRRSPPKIPKPRLKQTMRKPEYDAKPKKTVMRKVGRRPPQ